MVMNRRGVTVLFCVLGLLPFAAHAQQGNERPRWQQQLSPAERERMMRSRPERRDERGGQPDRRQMSADERQQLRRDISDHGRDIYGGQPGGNRSGQGRPQRR
jgi:hypothetical protein